MFNIAVLVYDLINSYNHTVVDGITNYFSDKPDVRLLIAPVNIPKDETSNYEFQFWSSVELLQSKQIDGVIIIPNSFSNYITIEKLSEKLKGYSGKPVVSVAEKINLPNCRYTLNTSKKAYELVIEHLKNKHNCKKIAFFGAGLIDSEEAKERFTSFKNALKKNKLEFDPTLVFEGDFTPGTAHRVLKEKIKSKEDINFDAICCVSDFTLCGCLGYFEEIGIKVPKDVILFGYDDIDFAITVFPTLSTVNQAIPYLGFKAGELLYKYLRKEDVPKKVLTESYPIYRQSCGCISCQSYTSAYYDNEGNFYEKDETKHRAELEKIRVSQKNLLDIYEMLTLMESKNPFEKIMDSVSPILNASDYSNLLVTTFDNPSIIEHKDDFYIPFSGKVRLFWDKFNKIENIYSNEDKADFNFKDRLIPAEHENLPAGIYLFHPIALQALNYGYMLCRCEKRNFILASINLKVISSIIVNSLEYSKYLERQEILLKRTETLSQSAKTDELTKLFNRRGFLDYGQRVIDLAVSMNKFGAVFFCDMDGLKKINDTYGHKIGDLAIKTQSEVLRASFREADLLGRLSGDEFCAISAGFIPEKMSVLREKITENNRIYSEKVGLPFVLSISIGVVQFDVNSSNLEELLQQADKNLYEEKEIKHNKRK